MGIFLLIGWNRIYETITDGYRITGTNIIVIDNCNLSEGGKCKMKNDKFCYDQIANKRTNKQLKRGTCAGCDKTAGETTSRGNVKGSAFNVIVIISAFILQYSQLSECSNCILLSAPNHECSDIGPNERIYTDKRPPRTLITNKWSKWQKNVCTFFISIGFQSLIEFMWVKEIRWMNGMADRKRRRNEAS